MIIGSHTIIQSTDADADRALVRDVLGLTGVDSGGGWLIFALPPSELAIHPSSKNDVHEHYLICADVEAFVRLRGAAADDDLVRARREHAAFEQSEAATQARRFWADAA